MGRNDSIIGTWKLVSAMVATLSNESRTGKLLGDNPSGFLTYTGDGRMTAILVSGGRQPLSVADPVTAPAAERAEAFTTFAAYAGRFTFDGDIVTHHIEVSLFQNRAGTEQIRFVRLQGNRLTLKTPPISVNGEQQVWELGWERLT
jgi:hypothetical protein